tara:strand:+ start:1865 stop:2467 length:603 start_codon:yes stop_codon:yes gene_type:complete
LVAATGGDTILIDTNISLVTRTISVTGLPIAARRDTLCVVAKVTFITDLVGQAGFTIATGRHAELSHTDITGIAAVFHRTRFAVATGRDTYIIDALVRGGTGVVVQTWLVFIARRDTQFFNANMIAIAAVAGKARLTIISPFRRCHTNFVLTNQTGVTGPVAIASPTQSPRLGRRYLNASIFLADQRFVTRAIAITRPSQ